MTEQWSISDCEQARRQTVARRSFYRSITIRLTRAISSSWEWQGEQRSYTDQFSGFSLFVSRKNPQVEASLHCASAIGAALKARGFHPTPHHAESIPGQNREWADQNNGVYYYDDLVVLKTAAMPAVLLEAGVIVNRDEEQAIQRPETRSAISNAVERGLLACGAI